jgi:micrococcal nuclease
MRANRAFLLLSLWALTVTPVIAPAQVKRADPTVYVTRTGHKYHRAGCRYLRRSMIAMRLSEAKRQGETACSVCRPPR